jgi:hypothetical protein
MVDTHNVKLRMASKMLLDYLLEHRESLQHLAQHGIPKRSLGYPQAETSDLGAEERFGEDSPEDHKESNEQPSL